jgi:hypothetical protein
MKWGHYILLSLFYCSSNPFEQDAHDKFMANLGEAIGFFMWLWIFHRARQDGPVVLGWRHPWEHAHDPWAIHETPAELYEFEQKTPKALYGKILQCLSLLLFIFFYILN